MDNQKTTAYINHLWDKSIIPALEKYIAIPNKSPHFDPNWKQNGYMDAAVKLIADWCKANALPTMQLEIVQLENRTPVILMELPGNSDETILMYGHLDKQPKCSAGTTALSPETGVAGRENVWSRCSR